MSDSHNEVLILAPHPDDETFGCGGTIKLLANAGLYVDVAFITSGEFGNEFPDLMSADLALAETRELEARAASDVLGIRRITFLRNQDTRVSESPHVAKQIADLLSDGDYERVFCPGPQERHVDHRATYAWLKLAMDKSGGNMDVWLYEVWTPLLPNMVVPIDLTFRDKTLAIQAYASQLKHIDYLAGISGLSAYRGMSCPNTRYAEAFLIHNARQLPQVNL